MLHIVFLLHRVVAFILLLSAVCVGAATLALVLVAILRLVRRASA
jgi:multisubunit Na+/H+ antiporter MnhC subunit